MPKTRNNLPQIWNIYLNEEESTSNEELTLNWEHALNHLRDSFTVQGIFLASGISGFGEQKRARLWRFGVRV